VATHLREAGQNARVVLLEVVLTWAVLAAPLAELEHAATRICIQVWIGYI